MSGKRQIHITPRNSINRERVESSPDLKDQTFYATRQEIFDFEDLLQERFALYYIVKLNELGDIIPIRKGKRGPYLIMLCRIDWGGDFSLFFYFLLVIVRPSPTSISFVSKFLFSSKLFKNVLNPLTAVLCLCLL